MDLDAGLQIPVHCQTEKWTLFTVWWSGINMSWRHQAKCLCDLFQTCMKNIRNHGRKYSTSVFHSLHKRHNIRQYAKFLKVYHLWSKTSKNGSRIFSSIDYMMRHACLEYVIVKFCLMSLISINKFLAYCGDSTSRFDKNKISRDM